MRTRSFRGQLEISEQRRIIVDDGRYTHGMRIVSLHIFPVIGGGTQLTSVTLATQDISNPDLDAGDSRQIGWATLGFGGANVDTQTQAVIDPEHVIINDLYVRNNNANDPVNYLIIAEPITMTDDQAILQLIKERGQNDI